ncbi:MULTISPECIES: hypothetical protein [Moorena]|nr:MULTISPECIES: hypothetical protein [Moorena]NEP32869.1 hypothetical protein [Moorena sp. SIO3B2]NEQ05705.1 hypothetical protein [Moorena sp. SIO4E2]NER90857.1 hypothetical protein [Moorena sp. SIO3A2]NES45259.1 hypothetical protein [Moorena sp. SIO2C4]NET67321.1 hypothetical protein [Moorena sp. SIO1G6]
MPSSHLKHSAFSIQHSANGLRPRYLRCYQLMGYAHATGTADATEGLV